KPCVPLRSRICVLPAVPFPTACQWKPPTPAVVSATPLAANTMSLLCRPMPLAFSSYHTVHGTVSLGPVKAMSGTSLLRVGSVLGPGPRGGGGGVGAPSRLTRVCGKEKLSRGVPLRGVTPAKDAAPEMPRDTKIWTLAAPSVVAPSCSRHPPHGTGLLPATAAP